MIDLAALALATVLAGGAGWPTLPADFPSRFRLTSVAPPEPVFRAGEAAVTTWRDGTRRTLEPLPLAAAAAALSLGRPIVSRCVKLNNPWCIKQARWPGELGGDDEGHTAFATTAHGADAAATLLRTYYVTYGRRSALDIVRRWAPAECRIAIGGGIPAELAVRGLGNTARARFLAGGGGSRTGTAQPRTAPRGAPRARVSAVPLAPLPSFRVPDLSPGLGERTAAPSRRPSNVALAPARAVPATPPRIRTAALAATAIPLPSPSLCGSEEGRIQYYAQSIGRALGALPAEDLKLFDAAGLPTENLLPVMVAMSAIELGFLHAGPELVEGAVERLRARLAEKARPAEDGVADTSAPAPSRPN